MTSRLQAWWMQPLEHRLYVWFTNYDPALKFRTGIANNRTIRECTGNYLLGSFETLKIKPALRCVESVHIRSFFWSVFSGIRAECGEIIRISPYSVRMWENTDQKELRIWTLFTQCWFTREKRQFHIYNLFKIISWLVKCVISRIIVKNGI